MGAGTQRSPLSRRTFLRVIGTASGAALASGLLGSCGSGPTASGAQVVNLLWSDVTNVRTPLIEDFTNATGIKVNQTIVQYNQRLNKIQTAVQGGSDFDVVQMDTVWTARFAAAGWVHDLTSRITDAIKRDVLPAALGAVTYNGKLYGMPLFSESATPRLKPLPGVMFPRRFKRCVASKSARTHSPSRFQLFAGKVLMPRAPLTLL